MKNNILGVFILLISCSVFAQIKEKTQKLKTLKNDTIKVKLLANIGYDYGLQNPDSAFYYYNQSIKLSAKLNYYSGLIKCNINIGELYRQMGDYNQSLKYDKINIKLAEKHGNQVKKANCYSNISTSFHYLLKFDSCTKYDLKALKIYESLKDKNPLVTFYSNISESYIERHLFDKSLEYGFKALEISKLGFGTPIDLVYVYSSISVSYLSLNQNEKALYYAEIAIKIARKEKEYYMQNIILGNILLIKINQKKYQDLFGIVAQLEAIKNNINSLEYNSSLLLNYGITFFYNNNEIKAKEYLLKALLISEANNFSVISKNAYSLLNRIEAKLGNYAAADNYEAKKDSIYELQLNEGTLKNIQELEKKYETQKKQSEIVGLKVQNEKKSNLNRILIASTIAFLLVGFLGYRNFRNKQKIQNLRINELEKDKQLFAIDAMLKGQEEERSRIAKDLHDGLGGLLSGTKLSFINMKENLILTPENAIQFDKSLRMLDNTINDLRKVAQNLMPEALVKFGLTEALKDFCGTIQTATNIEIGYQKIGEERKLVNTAEVFIYRIIQELVNNAVKHAKAKEIIVQLAFTKNKIIITVEDDGVGYDLNAIKLNSGAGLENIAYRVDYFNGTIDTITSPNNGTSVNIELNV